MTRTANDRPARPRVAVGFAAFALLLLLTWSGAAAHAAGHADAGPERCAICTLASDLLAPPTSGAPATPPPGDVTTVVVAPVPVQAQPLLRASAPRAPPGIAPQPHPA